MYPGDHKILVVECEAIRRETLARILGEEGFAVTAVGEGLAALRVLGKTRFALIIAAVELPGALDGIGTVRQARVRQPALKALFTGAALAPWCDSAEPADFIAIPCHRRELLGCVFEILHRDPVRAAADRIRRCRAERRLS